MLKMVIIAYNEAIDTEVMEMMEKYNLKNYTKVMGVFGRGETSGTHLGNDIWPGRNNLLYVAIPENAAITATITKILHTFICLSSFGLKC